MKNPTQRSLQRTMWFILVSLLAISVRQTSVAADPVQAEGVVRLVNGDYAAGSLDDWTDNNRIRWQHPHFQMPLDFSIDSIAGVSFFTDELNKPATGKSAIELTGGDRLFGDVIGLDDHSIQLRTDHFGDVAVSRPGIRRLMRWQDGNAVSFMGTGTLSEWNKYGGRNAWREIAGQIRSETDRATLFRNVELGPVSQVNLELSWEGTPNFLLALGVLKENRQKSSKTAFRIEVWDEEVVAVWESDELADVTVIGKLSQMNEQLELTIQLDQATRHARILSPQGELIAELHVADRDTPRIHPGIWLNNLKGIVSLDSIQIFSLDEKVSLSEATTEDGHSDTFFLDNGKVLTGQWTASSDDAWVLTDQEAEHQISPSRVRQVEFARHDGKETKATDGSPRIQIVTHDGSRLTGQIENMQDRCLSLTSDALDASVSIAVDQIRSLDVLGATVSRGKDFGPGVARLETTDTRLHGRLIDSDQTGGVMFELLNGSASIMSPGLSGRLVFRDPEPKPVVTVAHPPDLNPRRHRREFGEPSRVPLATIRKPPSFHLKRCV